MFTTRLTTKPKSEVIIWSVVILSVLALILTVSAIMDYYAAGVSINGKRVGFVKSKAELTELVDDVKLELSKKNQNADIQVEETALDLEPMAEPRDDVKLMNEEQLEEELVSTNAVEADATAINVDGKPVLYVGSEEDANNVLDAIKQKYSVNGQDVVTKFKEDVSVTSASIDVNTDKLMSTDDAVEYLNSGNENSKPLVHYEVTATVGGKEEVKFKTKKIETDELYKGENQVREEGKNGESYITKRAIYVNGEETKADVVSERVITEPKTKILIVGDKDKPVNDGESYTGGNGTLSNPMRSLNVSSPFGQRGGRLHAGIDFRNPAGTSIYAADGGTVTSAGWHGGYGKAVMIDHGNGIVTLYGHCSSLYVSNGERVHRGEKIAAVGSTGNSTGNHLHFEVRVNGSPVNPWNYL